MSTGKTPPFDVENLLKLAVDFQAVSTEAREKAREVFRETEPSGESSLRILIDGFIAKLALVTNKRIISDTDEKKSYQLSLSASFCRTHYLINDLIMCGDLIEGLVLIRKQLESLTRMYELDKTPLQKLLKRTPNVTNVFGKSGKVMYPQLSEFAHFATPRVGELLSVVEKGELRGPSLVPEFSEAAFGCYEFHVLVSIYFFPFFIDKLQEFYSDYDSSEDMEIFETIVTFALKENIICPIGETS